MKKITALLLAIAIVCVLGLPFFSASETSFLLGDVDGDGDVSIIDATIIQRVLADTITDEDGMYTLRGDVDGDGEVSTLDSTYIKRIIARMKR